jgi:hypothetical protein
MTEIATEEKQPLLQIATSDGKYTIIAPGDGTSHALRYGEPWQVYPEGGSLGNLALAFAFELTRTRQDLAAAQEEVNDLKLQINHGGR